ncbi:MAG: FAD-containing oxidoreductase [Acidobacteriota bacterium]|nr:FAD-containing oxidoreductase [Acidobacteriota bacterium]
MTSFDAIVIGTGQSGPPLAVRLAGAGWKVAVIERKLFGGTCVNTGCIPTKTLVASARAAHIARRAAEFGVVLNGAVAVDMKRVKARKDAIVRRSHDGVEEQLKSTPNCTVIEAQARFEGPHTVRAGDKLLKAKNIFIDVGGRASIPPIPGLQDIEYLTNSSMMDVDFLPEHLIVLGGSYVGLEFGQMYRRFGSEVTIVERGESLIGHEDKDISQAVREILEGEGIRIVTSAANVRVSTTNGAANGATKVAWDGGEASGSHLLVAVGRVPNTGDLGLDTAGVKMDPSGFIQVDDRLRTSAPGIWAMGDCNGKGAFTHTSYNDYEIVAANLLDGDARRVTDRILAYNLYIDPPLGRAGMTERDIRQAGRKALMATRPMTRVGRAIEKAETQGFLKVLVDPYTRQILGASLLGIECDEVIHSILDLMYARAPYTVMQRAVHIHPTVSELLPTLLGDLKSL